MLKLSEADVQRTCEDILQLDGWRIFRLEQNYSEKKRKVIGEAGAPDCLAIRYNQGSTPQARKVDCEVMMIEWKSKRGSAKPHQRDWHIAERKRGALTLIAGQDFPKTIEGFMEFYRHSGLMRRAI